MSKQFEKSSNNYDNQKKKKHWDQDGDKIVVKITCTIRSKKKLIGKHAKEKKIKRKR